MDGKGFVRKRTSSVRLLENFVVLPGCLLLGAISHPVGRWFHHAVPAHVAGKGTHVAIFTLMVRWVHATVPSFVETPEAVFRRSTYIVRNIIVVHSRSAYLFKMV